MRFFVKNSNNGCYWGYAFRNDARSINLAEQFNTDQYCINTIESCYDLTLIPVGSNHHNSEIKLQR
ncbi:hypothetical protein [Vibrio phage vB_VpaP_SJSY21]|nr:hypothetical protein [Vibrio phage vB_VpaP_SJSY21]